MKAIEVAQPIWSSGCPTMAFASIYYTHPKTNSLDFGNKYVLRIGGDENLRFFETAILDFVFKSSLWKSVKNSWVEKMGRNFDDYSGFQHKTTSAKKYATQSLLISALQICLYSIIFTLNTVQSTSGSHLSTALG